MPEPHPAEVRLAALRALLREVVDGDADAPAEADGPVAAMLAKGLSLREIALALEFEVDIVRSSAMRISRSGGVPRGSCRGGQ